MSRGRKRTPTRILKLRGSFDKHPERKAERDGEPELPLGIGHPPKKFDAAQVECWNELAAEGVTWLTRGDRFLLEQAAKLLARDRRSDLETSDGKRFDKMLGDLGFGPVARTRVKVTHAPDKKKSLLA